jgi:hypothetical protein
MDPLGPTLECGGVWVRVADPKRVTLLFPLRRHTLISTKSTVAVVFGNECDPCSGLPALRAPRSAPAPALRARTHTRAPHPRSAPALRARAPHPHPHPRPAPAPHTRAPHPRSAPALRTRAPHPHSAPALRTRTPHPRSAPALRTRAPSPRPVAPRPATLRADPLPAAPHLRARSRPDPPRSAQTLCPLLPISAAATVPRRADKI